MGYKIDKNGALISAKVNRRHNKVSLPDKIVTIGNSAFSNSEFLEKVYVPESVTTIEDSAFKNCKFLNEVVLPSKIKRLGTTTFYNCIALQIINLPSDLSVIESGCFYDCFSLESIELPESINYIGKEAFYNTGLKSVKMPSSILWIADGAFKKCKQLKLISLPQNLEILGNRTFDECYNLKQIILPESLKKIGDGCFSWCEKLKEISIPNKITIISNDLFINCRGLEKVDLHDNVTSIGEFAFCNCEKLKDINIPSKVTSIGKFAFSGCESLDKVELSEGISSIEAQAFSKTNIERIVIPESTSEIGEKCFDGCDNLVFVKLPTGLKKISSGLFHKCTSLEKIDIPSGVENIGSQAFDGCKNMHSIILPEGLKKINSKAFANSGIENITIPESVDFIGEHAFLGCSNLKTIRISNYSLFHLMGISELVLKYSNFYYDDVTGEIIIATNEITDENLTKINYREIMGSIKCNKSSGIVLGALVKSESIIKSPYIRDALDTFVKQSVNRSNHKEVLKNLDNHKEFDLLCRRVFNRYSSVRSVYVNDLLKLAYSLGAFNEEKPIRQKACEFLINAFTSNKLSVNRVHGSFDSLKFAGYNKEWAEFFFNKENFEELLLLEKEESGYIAKIYNDFMKIKEFARSNRGSQRYRKVTIEICKKYFATVNFEGVDEDNIDISAELSKYTRSQESFDEAVEIRKEYASIKLTGRIKEQIIDDINEILINLNKVSNDKFSSEFLSKNDPLNFTLGKYCSCCAHIEGEGRGIMKASILHPDCQNLVIKDSNGTIVAKSTLYINKNKGYGVFNNVEINDKIVDSRIKGLIYKKYIEAIRCFAEQYNKENSLNPLRQINVGMGLNDLRDEIMLHNETSDIILKGIDFSNYGGYMGDWQHSQYIVWKDDNQKRK